MIGLAEAGLTTHVLHLSFPLNCHLGIARATVAGPFERNEHAAVIHRHDSASGTVCSPGSALETAAICWLTIYWRVRIDCNIRPDTGQVIDRHGVCSGRVSPTNLHRVMRDASSKTVSADLTCLSAQTEANSVP